jgi:hypothetical protein
MPQAKGEFEVTRDMEPALALGDGVEAMHVRFEKKFSGPLQASSVVHMLAAVTAVEAFFLRATRRRPSAASRRRRRERSSEAVQSSAEPMSRWSWNINSPFWRLRG